MLKREIEILSKLKHPFIVNLVETFETGLGSARATNIVLEYVDGENLTS
jgi:serine/threonine protein kinase